MSVSSKLPIRPYDVKRLEQQLAESGTRLVYIPETPSTMDDAAELSLQSAIVLTNHQTAGHGRYERTWHDEPATSILMTLVKRVPVAALPQKGSLVLSHLFCLSIWQALRNVLPEVPVQIRWPNDLNIHDRKLGGVLLIEGARENDYQAILFGVGINVVAPIAPELETRSSLPIGLAEIASTDIDRGEIVARINRELDAMLPDISRINDPLTLDYYDKLWSQASSLRGRTVRVSGLGATADETLEGQVTATPFGGSLQLTLRDGAIIEMNEYGHRASLTIIS